MISGKFINSLNNKTEIWRRGEKFHWLNKKNADSDVLGPKTVIINSDSWTGEKPKTLKCNYGSHFFCELWQLAEFQ